MADATCSHPLQVKIGKSNDVDKRRQDLQSGAHYRLALMGWIRSDDDAQLERELHTKYAADRGRGEWFELSVPIVFSELARFSSRAFVARQKTAGAFLGRDRDGIPEYESTWEWCDLPPEKCCPDCGWCGGVHYQSASAGSLCLNCGWPLFPTHISTYQPDPDP